MDNRQAVKAANKRRQCWPDKRPDDPGPLPSDGCTWFFDGDWVSCCQRHDLRFQKGGTEADRLFADQELRDCIANSGAEWWRGPLAEVMYRTVRITGAPYIPLGFRWGVGGSGYLDFRWWRERLGRFLP